MGPADIWDNYIRYIGAGAVAFGGLVTLIRAIPTMVRSFGSGVKEVARDRAGGGSVKRTSLDLPVKWVMVGATGTRECSRGFSLRYPSTPSAPS